MITEIKTQLACEIYELNLKILQCGLNFLCEIEKSRPGIKSVVDGIRTAQKDFIADSVRYRSEYLQMDEESLAMHKEKILNSMEMIASAFLALSINGMSGGLNG